MVTNVDTLLQVRDLTVSYGSVVALNNASFCVNHGEIVAMVGPNGAGKSTALKAVSGVLQQTGGRINSGKVLFDGKNLKGLRTDQLVASGISLVPEGRHVFPGMTVLENLEIGAYTRKGKSAIRQEINGIFDLFPRLASRAKQRAGTLSVGEQQMLAIGRALMLKPKLLLADEPSLGLSPNFIDIVFNKLSEINKSGTSILLVEQNALMALDICTRGYVFRIGSIVHHGTKDELFARGDFKEVFLGEGPSDNISYTAT